MDLKTLLSNAKRRKVENVQEGQKLEKQVAKTVIGLMADGPSTSNLTSQLDLDIENSTPTFMQANPEPSEQEQLLTSDDNCDDGHNFDITDRQVENISESGKTS
jgi:hypothetical protein